MAFSLKNFVRKIFQRENPDDFHLEELEQKNASQTCIKSGNNKSFQGIKDDCGKNA
jgi:hypothetical protein